MELVADESVDQQIVEALRSNGHTVEAIVESCPGSADDDVLALAANAGALLLTQDKVLATAKKRGYSPLSGSRLMPGTS